MKKHIFASLMAVAVVAMLSLTSCNKEDSTALTDDGIGYIESTDFMVPAMDAGTTDITEPTEAAAMQMLPGMDMDKVMNKPAKGTPHKGDLLPGHPGMFDFRKIFRRLALTDTQLNAIRPLTEAYRECVRAAALALRTSEQAIIDAKNTERNAVIDSLRAGSLTKAQARARLLQIMKETRTALKDYPARTEFKTATCSCLTTLFAGIEAVLTPDQLYKWEAWKLLLKNECINP